MIGEIAMTYSPVPFPSLELDFMEDVPYKVKEEEEEGEEEGEEEEEKLSLLFLAPCFVILCKAIE
jgi:hypothetical protein